MYWLSWTEISQKLFKEIALKEEKEKKIHFVVQMVIEIWKLSNIFLWIESLNSLYFFR